MLADLAAETVRGAVALWPLLALLAQAILTVASCWLVRRFVPRRDYETRAAAVDRRLDECDRRLTGMEREVSAVSTSLEDLPRRDDLLAIRLGMEEIRGVVREVVAWQEGLKALVSRLEQQTTILNKSLLTRRS